MKLSIFKNETNVLYNQLFNDGRINKTNRACIIKNCKGFLNNQLGNDGDNNKTNRVQPGYLFSDITEFYAQKLVFVCSK
jgi:hypothetical protein